MSTSGIDIRQTNTRILFEALLTGLGGAIVTSGTCELRVYELQDDGTLKVYDWTTHDWVATGAGTPDDETTMTHRQRRDSTGADLDTGIWTKVLATLTNWTAGNIYFVEVYHADALPTIQMHKLQFGAANNASDYAGQLRRMHALAGGNKVSKDHGLTNPTWVSRDETDNADLITRTRTQDGDVETVTPS